MATQDQIDAFTGMLAAGDVAGATSLAESLGYNAGQVDEYIGANPGSVGGGGASNLAQGLLNQYEQAMGSGDYVGASNLINQAAAIYGPETYANLADYLNTQEQFGGLRDVVGGSIYTPENVKYFAETISDIGVDAIPAFYVDPQAYGMLTQFDDLIAAGDFENAALLVDEAAGIYGEDATLQNIADYLNTNPRFEDLRKAVGDKEYTSGNIKEFITSVKNPTKPIVPPVPTGTSTAGLSSIPRLERQTPSMISFAPLQRGLAQLRPAAFMPGLLEGTPGFGGSGFTPEQLQQATTSLVEEGTAAGKTPEQIYQDFAYLMDVGGVSAAELAAAIGGAPGQIQGLYNQARPQGLFSTAPPPRQGPTFKDTSQLGAFNTAIAQGDFATGAQIAQAAGFSPQEAEYYINANLSGLNQAQPIAPGTIGSLYGPNAPTPPGLALQTGAYGATVPTFLAQPATPAEPFPSAPIQGTDYTNRPIIGYTGAGDPIYSPNAPNYFDGGGGGDGDSSAGSGESATGDGTGADSDGGPGGGGDPSADFAEGGMPKLSAEDAGSKFDVSEFIDEQGRLVGGYNRPIYENNVLVDYEFVPYGRDVVFGEELRERESRGSSASELEMAMRAMLARQGRTGVSPYTGGLPGIMAREAVMRRRPEYYNFAKGGDVSATAQDLASRGRGGDTMLVHMAPHEVAGLNALARMQGTELTINPETGMPEALKLGKLFKQLAPMALGFALGPAGAGIFSSALGAGLAVGAGYTLATGSLQQGIAAGLGAYGGSNLATGLQAAGADAAASAGAQQAASSGVSSAAGGNAAQAAMVNPMQVTGPTTTGGLSSFADVSKTPLNFAPRSVVQGGGFGATVASAPVIPADTFGSAFQPVGDLVASSVPAAVPPPTTTVPIETVQIGGPQAGMRTTELATVPQSTSGSALTGAERYFGDKATSDLAAQRYADATGSTLSTSLMQTVGGMGLQSAAAEEAAIKARQASINREREERKRLFDQLFGRTLGAVPARSGGLMKLAGGGMTYMEAGGTTGPTGVPRDVTGTGDGMSDSVPATIEGVQEARLADGEFVIPADVVADIGNGSSDAGSKKLYDMMDRIRMARHGTKEQPPEIKAERLMPA